MRIIVSENSYIKLKVLNMTTILTAKIEGNRFLSSAGFVSSKENTSLFLFKIVSES